MNGILFGERELRTIAERAMRAAKGDQAEALVIGKTVSLTRFANSAIHQNVTSREAELRVRVVLGTRRATATTNRLDDDGIRRAAELASDLARRAPEDPTFPGLPAPRPIPSAPSGYVEKTAEATPLDRARAAKTPGTARWRKAMRNRKVGRPHMSQRSAGGRRAVATAGGPPIGPIVRVR